MYSALDQTSAVHVECLVDTLRREQLQEGGHDGSWSSRTYPPTYSPYPDTHNPSDPANAPEAFNNNFGHNPSTKKGLGNQTEIYAGGLESVWHGEGDKEVLPYHAPEAPQVVEQPEPVSEKPTAHRTCGMPRKTFWVVLIILIALILGLGIGLGVGLGVGLKKSSSSSSSSDAPVVDPAYEIGGALNASYYSTKGAFNGSGIALASESFDTTTHGALNMYFQHWTGEIRYMQLDQNGDWVGGDSSSIVASNAKNGTPISAVAYASNHTATVRADFCIVALRD